MGFDILSICQGVLYFSIWLSGSVQSLLMIGSRSPEEWAKTCQVWYHFLEPYPPPIGFVDSGIRVNVSAGFDTPYEFSMKWRGGREDCHPVQACTNNLGPQLFGFWSCMFFGVQAWFLHKKSSITDPSFMAGVLIWIKNTIAAFGIGVATVMCAGLTMVGLYVGNMLMVMRLENWGHDSNSDENQEGMEAMRIIFIIFCSGLALAICGGGSFLVFRNCASQSIDPAEWQRMTLYLQKELDMISGTWKCCGSGWLLAGLLFGWKFITKMVRFTLLPSQVLMPLTSMDRHPHCSSVLVTEVESHVWWYCTLFVIADASTGFCFELLWEKIGDKAADYFSYYHRFFFIAAIPAYLTTICLQPWTYLISINFQIVFKWSGIFLFDIIAFLNLAACAVDAVNNAINSRATGNQGLATGKKVAADVEDATAVVIGARTVDKK